MPPDLTAFAKEFDIQLLTHNDPKGKIKVLFFYLDGLDGFKVKFLSAKRFMNRVQVFSVLSQTLKVLRYSMFSIVNY